MCFLAGFDYAGTSDSLLMVPWSPALSNGSITDQEDCSNNLQDTLFPWPLSKYITSDNVLQNSNPWESAWPACLLVIWWKPWRSLIQHSCNGMLKSGAFCQFLCPPPPSRWLQGWSLDLVVTTLLGIPSIPWYAADLHCTLIWNLADVLSARDCLNSETLLITIFLSILLPFHQWTFWTCAWCGCCFSVCIAWTVLPPCSWAILLAWFFKSKNGKATKSNLCAWTQEILGFGGKRGEIVQ